jgi:RHS repeat-associated protein
MRGSISMTRSAICSTDPRFSPSRSTGKERDSESGNDYFGARYYSSAMGRFMSPDWSAKVAPVPYAKLGNPQSLNLYSYVYNNPLSNVDPDGHLGCGFLWLGNCPTPAPTPQPARAPNPAPTTQTPTPSPTPVPLAAAMQYPGNDAAAQAAKAATRILKPTPNPIPTEPVGIPGQSVPPVAMKPGDIPPPAEGAPAIDKLRFAAGKTMEALGEVMGAAANAAGKSFVDVILCATCGNSDAERKARGLPPMD